MKTPRSILFVLAVAASFLRIKRWGRAEAATIIIRAVAMLAVLRMSAAGRRMSAVGRRILAVRGRRSAMPQLSACLTWLALPSFMHRSTRRSPGRTFRGRKSRGRKLLSRPNASRPNISRPEISRPEFTRPNTSRPALENRPDFAHRPAIEGRPDIVGRPGIENRPQSRADFFGRPGIAEHPGLGVRPSLVNHPEYFNRTGVGNRTGFVDNRGNFGRRSDSPARGITAIGTITGTTITITIGTTGRFGGGATTGGAPVIFPVMPPGKSRGRGAIGRITTRITPSR